MINKARPSRLGTVVSVRGSVVNIRFAGHLPPIYSLLPVVDSSPSSCRHVQWNFVEWRARPTANILWLG
jgi:F0F1-type ATP synthase beta subunit